MYVSSPTLGALLSGKEKPYEASGPMLSGDNSSVYEYLMVAFPLAQSSLTPLIFNKVRLFYIFSFDKKSYPIQPDNSPNNIPEWP
jgi:hypothetical protein